MKAILVCLLLAGLLCTAHAEEVLRGELRRLRAGGGGGGAAGAAGGQDSDYNMNNKIQVALLGAHTAIARAVESRNPQKAIPRATAVNSMLTAASTDRGVSDTAMDAIMSMADGGARRLSGADLQPEHHRMAGVAEVSAAIAKAASSTKPAAAKAAARAGSDMAFVITNPVPTFPIDHVPDMQPADRKLLAGSPRGEDTLIAAQDTTEAILNLGARATGVAAINARGAGMRGGNHFVSQMTDTIVHRMGADKPSAPRKLLAA